MRQRASFALAAILATALLAVVGFAAFSTQGSSTPAPTTTTRSPDAATTGVPTTASGRVLGAVVAAALIPEPEPEEPTVTTVAGVQARDEDDEDEPTVTRKPKTETTTAAAAPPDSKPPDIEISWPKDDAEFDDNFIEFRGTTEPGATVTSGNYEAAVDDDGEWKLKLVLREGRNRASFTAEDAAGNTATVSIMVSYDPPPETTTTRRPRTTTTTKPPQTTTTTTTEPPVKGGRRDVEEWRPLVEQYFLPELVEEALVVMQCESKGDPLAYNSRSGASGLYQFIERTWNWASKNAGWAGASPFDPEANIAAAAWLTEYSLNRGNDPWSHWSCKP